MSNITQILHHHRCFYLDMTFNITMRAWQALQTLCSRQARLVTRECPALKPMNWEAELQDIANFRWKTWHKWNTGSMVTQSFFCRPTTDPSGKQIQWEIMRKQSSNKTYSCFGYNGRSWESKAATKHIHALGLMSSPDHMFTKRPVSLMPKLVILADMRVRMER